MANIELSGLSKSYNTNPVLREVSLRIDHGECFTLLGPSGCGKTVLLRLLAGFEKPDAGTIRIGGELVADSTSSLFVPPNQRGLGVVFQEYAVWPHMTVRGNIAYPLKLAKVPERELTARVDEVLGQVNLEGLADRLPSQLSGGQQQRVALARALVAKPALLLLDEPLCNLDAGLREEMRFEIKELQKSLGITILYVTHDQEIALAISDRLAVMDKDGKIRQIGTPQEVYEAPADRFVFNFLGVANFLPTAVSGIVDIVLERPPGFHRQGIGTTPSVDLGFRPSDVILAKDGPGLACFVQRASFLGATVDYLLRIGDKTFRTQLDSALAHDAGLLFNEGDTCMVQLRAAHCFAGEKLLDKEEKR